MLRFSLKTDNKSLQIAIQNAGSYLKAIPDDKGISLYATEGKDLSVRFGEGRIDVTYPCVAGFLRALMLAAKATEERTFSPISEYPYIPEVGVMLDLSRNGVMTVEALKDFVRQMAVMGLNQLYLYMEDTYTIDEEPYFGYMRGRYSKEELRQIDAFCASVGVEAIPHIQTLGHMSQWIKWDAGIPMRDTAEILLAGEERTYEFLDGAIRSVSSCFRTKKIHIGCDEAGALGTGRYEKKHGQRPKHEILLDHLERVGKICETYGLTPIAYSDVLMSSLSAAGLLPKAGEKTELPESIRKKLPKNLYVVPWNYDAKTEEAYEKIIAPHKAVTDNIIYWSAIWTWFGFLPDNRQTAETALPALNVCKRLGIRSAIGSLWGDNGCECDYRMSVFGLQVFAESAYRAEVTEEDIWEAFRFFTDADEGIFRAMSEFHNHFTAENQYDFYVYRYYGKRFVWSDLMIGLMDEELARRPMSEHYRALSELRPQTPSPKYDAFYDFFTKLVTFLSHKCYLSERLQPAYKAGDRATLSHIAEVEIPLLKTEQRALRDAHKALWLSGYKPFGFEVLDVRYGGLQNRFDYCAERLRDYLSGKVEVLDELEQTRLPHTIEWTQKNFASIVTACFGV